MKIEEYPKITINFSPEIPKLKKFQDKTKINVRYPLISPFVFAHIYWDQKISQVVYDIEEPILDEKEKKYVEEITSAMKEMINVDEVIEQDEEKMMEYLDKMFKILAVELGMDVDYESYKKIYYYLCRN